MIMDKNMEKNADKMTWIAYAKGSQAYCIGAAPSLERALELVRARIGSWYELPSMMGFKTIRAPLPAGIAIVGGGSVWTAEGDPYIGLTFDMEGPATDKLVVGLADVDLATVRNIVWAIVGASVEWADYYPLRREQEE